MKKRILFYTVLLLSFTACKKDNPIPPTTYQIVNNTVKLNYEFEPLLDGSIYEVEIFWYNDMDIIVKEYNLSQVKSGGGISLLTEVTSDVVKVKISFKMLPAQSDYYSNAINNRFFVNDYTYLKKGGNTLITVDEQTMVSNVLSSVFNPSKLDLSRFKALIQK